VTTPVRYALFQVPSALLSALVLVWLWPATDLAAWVGALVWCVWVAKDAALYPLVRSAYDTSSPTGAERMVGETGITGTTLGPIGQVRVRGELWRACSTDGNEIPARAVVRIERAEGLTLFVSPADPRRAPGQ
jgi:membrane-bound serine protease (ClpP class)